MKKLKNWFRVCVGFSKFLATGKQQEKSYQAMLGLFCQTGGNSNDLISKTISLFREKINLKFSIEEENALKKWLVELKNNGIVHLGDYLSTDICKKLELWARSNPATPKPKRSDIEHSIIPNPESPISEGYTFSEEQLIKIPEIQEIMSDSKILGLAQNYFNCAPILSNVSMWWSCAGKFSDNGTSALAQMYHFDMDRPKWIKVFFYLNDVTLKNGPHVFVLKSHQTGKFPKELLQKGYARLSDDEVNKFFSEEEQLKIIGRRGSAFAEDTRGIHKGLVPEIGYRLVLQLEYANSLFGSFCESKIKIRKTELSNQAKQSILLYPSVFRRFALN